MDFVEVYIDCPIEVCEQRDPKGLYINGREPARSATSPGYPSLTKRRKSPSSSWPPIERLPYRAPNGWSSTSRKTAFCAATSPECIVSG